MTDLVPVAVRWCFMKRTIGYGKCSSHNQKPDSNPAIEGSDMNDTINPGDYSREEIAAKVADRVPHADLDGFSLSERLRIGAAVAPLFHELLGTRPLLDRTTVKAVLDRRLHGEQVVDLVMDLARPMPTAEQIAMKLSLVRFSDEESDRMIELTMREAWPLADAVVALLKGDGP